MEYLHEDLTELIIECVYKVHRSLGFGFLERVYQNALYFELINNGLECDCQKPIKVYYDGNIVGDYIADIIVNDCIILELKAVEKVGKEHELQLINYLKATNVEIGLLVNFGKQAEIKRKIFTNDRKTNFNNVL